MPIKEVYRIWIWPYRAMEDIEQNLDAESRETIEVALEDLKKVSNEIKMQ